MSKITKALDYKQYPSDFKEYMTEEVNMVKNFVSGTNKLLEVGFGMGRNINDVAPLVNQYYGIEIDKEALRVANEKYKHFSNIKLTEMNASELIKKFGKDYFDKTICLFNTIGCTLNPDEILKNISLVTKNSFLITLQRKGTLSSRVEYYKNLKIPYTIEQKTETIISDAWGESRAYSQEEIKKMAERLNIHIVEIKNIGKLAVGVVFKK